MALARKQVNSSHQHLSLHRTLLKVAAVTGALLLVPLIAMQFTTEVSWGPGDFLAAGALIFAVGVAIAVAGQRVQGRLRRAAIIAAILLGAALVWAELAVGIFW